MRITMLRLNAAVGSRQSSGRYKYLKKQDPMKFSESVRDGCSDHKGASLLKRQKNSKEYTFSIDS